jgi:hypothetical protein
VASHTLGGDEKTSGMMAQVDRNRTQFIDLAQMCLSAAEVPLGDFWHASVVVGMPGHFVAKSVTSHEPPCFHASVLRITGSLNS